MSFPGLRWLIIAGTACGLLLTSGGPGSAQRTRPSGGGGGLSVGLPQVLIGGALAISKASKAAKARRDAAAAAARKKRPPKRPAGSKPSRDKHETATSPDRRRHRVAKPTEPSVDRPVPPPSKRPNRRDTPGGKVETARPGPFGPVVLPRPVATRLGAVATDATEMPDEVLVTHLPSVSDAAMDDLARRFGLTVLERMTASLVDLRVVRLSLPAGRDTNSVVQELATLPEIVGAQPNHIYRRQQSAAAASPPGQYAMAKLAADSPAVSASGRGVAIAVIDTGVDASHPDLKSASVEGRDFLGEGSAEDDPAHATAIAGIIAADGTTRGIARDARIISLRAFATFLPSDEHRPQRSTSMVLVKAIDAAVAEGARVLNLSFAGPRDALLERMLGEADKRNIVAVAAAGNGGAEAKPAYPAAYASVIAVTATDARDHLYEAANRGAYVAIAAPGVELLAASADHGHELVSGTSFATAYISGLAALLLERAPELTPAEIRTALTDTAVDLGSPGRDEAFGAGLANAGAALSHRLVVEAKP